jgi:putative oxygen-independent coproporphyrinogen III oxidase
LAVSTAAAVAAPVSLYVHVPFCLAVCPYCDFVVYGGRHARGPANRIAATVEALATEIRLRAPARPARPLRSVYFGGGTPSLLLPAQVERLLAVAHDAFGLAADAEVSLECNPGPGDRGDLAGLAAAGVNRLSVGAQSLLDVDLGALGRRHTAADVVATVGGARRAGFTNVSLDLLYDVPGQTLASWRATVQAALRLEPEHVSAYALTLDSDPVADGSTDHAGDRLPARAGALNWRHLARAAQDEDRAANCYELADDLLSAEGLRWYEISNWARPGFESRHNLAYWNSEPWQAVGPSAHAFDGRTRRWNGANLGAYLAALLPANDSSPRLPPGGAEAASPAIAQAELAILRLRTADGLPRDVAQRAAFAAGLAWARANGLAEPTAGGGVRLTRHGRLLAGELFVRLLPEPRRERAAVRAMA